MHRLILASESPRRRELLARCGFRFTVFPVKVSEIPDENLNVREQISQIARTKIDEAFRQLSSTMGPSDSPFVVLSADTEVIWEGRPLGKPSSPEDAASTLRRLSGHVHDVITAVWMIDSSSKKEISHIETTRVFMKTLSEKEISDYVATGEPMGKAGSYGIQGAGGRLIDHFEGDYENVVGLPVSSVMKIVTREGWRFES